MPGSQAIAPSLIEKLTHGRWKPMWSIRLFTAFALTTTVLALAVFKTGNAHAFCQGLTLGILLGLLTQTFATQATDSSTANLRSDVESYNR
jgi:hypothetical protein